MSLKMQAFAGEYFMSGNLACAEGAIAAGCRFYGGYPITPSSEIAEHMSRRLPQVGGHYLQMEDEIGSIAAVVGASNAGAKSMTATSGPGFSLMMENIGLGVITETPCVLVNVQRAGPSTGIPTLIGQGDMMQVKWGSHGDYEIIAYAPNSVQEMFDLTVKAFNMAEKYRTPTFVMADQVVAHMTSKVVIPTPDKIQIVNRIKPLKFDPDFTPFPYNQDFPPMAMAGDGFHVNVDSLTHDERGYPSLDNSVSQRMLDHLTGKILNHVDEIVETEEYSTDDAEVIIIAYGSTSRSALRVVKEARQKEKKVGLVRLITPWPFPSKRIEALGEQVRAMIVPEINYGQMEHVVREFASCPVIGVHHPAGALIPPQKIDSALEKL
ncbi:MAG TPA: 2-oxoacid:acceptor oxidoreductase subunit alpha [archaeon]|nr:2-oxoacid:acceptor oxidoreductase subunit alpha [archaeon]